MGFLSSLHRTSLAVRLISFRLGHIMTALAQLQSDVSANADVIASAVTLLTGIKSQLDAAIAANANGDNSAALNDLSAKLESNTSALAAAIAANTPAAPAPAPAVDPNAAP